MWKNDTFYFLFRCNFKAVNIETLFEEFQNDQNMAFKSIMSGDIYLFVSKSDLIVSEQYKLYQIVLMLKYTLNFLLRFEDLPFHCSRF